MARKVDKKARKLESRRASRLRGKKRNGEELSEDDERWLEAYDASKAPTGRKTEPVADAEDDSADDETADDAPDDAPDDAAKVDTAPDVPQVDGSPAGAAPPPPAAETPSPSMPGAAPAVPPPLPKAPRNPVPPRVKIRVDEDAPAGKARGDWRDKYKGDAQAGNREQTCLLLGGYWLGALTQMADALKGAGIDPVVKPETLGGAIVLTLDEILPDSMEVTPKVVAVGGSTALMVQRFVRRDDIAKAGKLAKERKDHDAWREEQRRAKERAEETRTSATASTPPAPVKNPSVPDAVATTTPTVVAPSQASAPTSAHRDSTPLQSAINGSSKHNRDSHAPAEFDVSDPRTVF